MSSPAFGALKRQQMLSATQLLLNMSFMVHNAVLVTTATVQQHSMESLQVTFSFFLLCIGRVVQVDSNGFVIVV